MIMYRRLFFLSLVLIQTLAAQVTELPPEAKRYHDLLKRRPQAGTMFDRFHDAWLEAASAETLLDFLKARAQGPGATAADHRLLGLLLARQGKDVEALAAVTDALKLAPGEADAWLEKARLQTRQTDFEGTLESLQQAADCKPGDLVRIEIARLQGRTLLRLNRTPEALEKWMGLMKEYPDDLDLAEDVVELMAEEGLYAEAAVEAGRLLGLTKDASEKLTRQLRLGELLLRAEKRDEALTMLEQALTTSGQDSWVESDVLARLDQVFRREDDMEGLKSRLEALLKAHPGRVQLGIHYARVLAELGDADGAASLFRELLGRNPGRRDLQESYISLLESLDKTEDATAQLQVLAGQHPEDKELVIRLAGLQQKQGDLSAAQASLDSYLVKSAVNATVPENDLLRVARLLENWEVKEAARGAFEKLAASFPESVSAQEALAHFYHRAEEEEAAMKIWKALTAKGELEDVLRVGQALMAHGLMKEAQSLVQTRLVDFPAEARLLSLLTQMAMANQDFEKAVEWSRARLLLVQDASGLQEAVKMAHHSLHQAKTADEAMEELTARQEELKVPERCLLSALLEDAGKEKEAIDVLSSEGAAPKDLLLLDKQKVRIFELRQQWEQAAEVLTQILQLPEGRTSDHVQQLAQLQRRLMQHDKALASLQEWKGLAPGSVQPWLEEHSILLEMARQSAALDVLRAASRKFSDNADVMSSLANALAMAGRTEEARDAYLALYEQTEDPVARLRFLTPLAQMAQSTGKLPQLLEDFQQRQRQNRGSALPWLALATLYAATGQDEERRRCLYEASTLKPKDLNLLTEIARIEEENGLFEEAERTLALAAKLDKTDATKQKMAELMIAAGDEDAGYRLMFELAGVDTADARTVEKMADKLCEHGQWERAVSLLNAQLTRFPKDYRLHYLHAVALEEDGQVKEAASAFLRLMDMHEELPEVLAAAASAASAAAASPRTVMMRRGQMPSLPPGTDEWMQFSFFSQLAYQHRQKQSASRGHSRAHPFNITTPVTPGLPAGWVTQPPDVTRLSGITLCHLVEISQEQTQEEKIFLGRQLTAKGIMEAEMLLDLPIYHGRLFISPELLDAYPEHLPLHALWLMNQHQQMHEDKYPLLERCVALFQPSYPHLAFQAGMVALVVKTPEADALAQKVLQTADSIAGSPETYHSQLLSALHTRLTGAAEEDRPAADLIDDAMKLAWKWTDILDQEQSQEGPSYVSHVMVATLIKLDQWDGVAGLIENNNARYLKHVQAGQSRPGFPPGYINLQPMQPVWKDLDVSPSSVQFLASLHPHPGEGNYTRGVSGGEESLPKLATVAGQITTPGLKIAFHAMLKDEAAVRTGLTKMLSHEGLKADHWIFAACMAQQIQDWPLVLGYLAKAKDAQPEASLRSMLDNAILYAALQIRGKGESLPENVHAPVLTSFESFRSSAGQSQNAGELISVAHSLGFDEQAKEMQQQQINSTKSAPGRTRPAMVNPYSQARNRSSQGNASKLGKLLAQNQDEAAYTELKKEILALSNTWTGPNWYSADNEAMTLSQVLHKANATSRYLEKIKAEPTSTWKMDRARGTFLELMEETEAAIGIYQSIVEKKPNDWFVHLRLASLLSDKDMDAALSHLLRIPAMEFTQNMQRLTKEMSQASSKRHVFEHRLAVIRLMTAYLEKKANLKRRPDPNLISMLQRMPQQIQEGGAKPLFFYALYQVSTSKDKMTPEGEAARARLRQAHDDFCLAMMKIPLLAQAGFGPYAGLAIQDGESLEKLEPVARQFMESQARMRRSSPYPGHGYNSGHQRYLTEPGQISNPHPEDVLLKLLLAQNAPEKIESELLPLIKKAAGSEAEGQMREYARMHTCQEGDFLDVAKSWARRVRPVPSDREIIRIWAERRLTTPIHDLFLAGLKNPQMRFNVQETGKYIETLHNSQIPAEASRFLNRVRDTLLGDEPEKRADLVRQHHEFSLLRQRSYHNPWQGSASRMAEFNQYVSLLSTLTQTSAAPIALQAAREDGLLDQPNLFSQICGNLSWEKAETSTVIASLEAMGIVGPAAQFRPWMRQGDDKGTYLKDLLYKFIYNEEFSKGITAALKDNVKPSFGRDLLLALTQKQEKEKQAGLVTFLEQRGQELSELGEKARNELAGFFSSQIPGYPHFLDEKFKAMLEPLFTAERQEADQLTDQLLAAATWEDASLLHPNPDNRVPELIESMAVTDRAKALKLLEHYHVLLTKTPQQQQARSQDQGPVAQLLARMGGVPSLMNEVLALAEKEGMGGQWYQSFYYQMENAGLNQKDHLLAIFTDTPFVAEAEHFRCLPQANNSEGSALLRLTRRLQNSSLLPGLVEDLEKRQPQTFGTRLTLALLENKITVLDDFIHENTEDFKKLAPKEASALLASFSAHYPRYREPATLPEDLRQALEPLIRSQEAEDEAFYHQVMDTPSLEAIRMSAENRQELMQRLSRLIRQKPKEGLEMFGKLTLLITAETRSGGSRQEHYWLSECATVPELFTPAMQHARNAGLMTDPQWMRQVAGGLNRDNQLSKAETVMSFLKGSPFLAEASDFDSYPVPGSEDGSLLGKLTRHVRIRQPVAMEVIKGLSKEPETFGHRLLRCLLDRQTTKPLCAFIEMHRDEIAALPPSSRAAFEQVVESTLKPLVAYAEHLKPLESLLKGRQIRATQARKDLLGVTTVQQIMGDHATCPLLDQLVLLVQHDPQGAKEALDHLVSIIEKQTPKDQVKFMITHFLTSLKADPGYWPLIVNEAIARGYHEGNGGSDIGDCSDYFLNSMKDEEYFVDAFMRSGLFGDASSFNPLVGFCQPTVTSFLHFLTQKNNTLYIYNNLRTYFSKSKNDTFGKALIAAITSSNRDHALNHFAERYGAEYQTLPKATQVAILTSIKGIWPSFNLGESAPEEVKAKLRPMLDVVKEESSRFKDMLLEAQTFEDLKIPADAFGRQSVDLIQALLNQGEGSKAETAFHKAAKMLEDSQVNPWEWDINIQGEGMSISSFFFGKAFQANSMAGLARGIKLLNENRGGKISYNGNHHRLNWGMYLQNRWNQYGSLADPAYAMEKILQELQPQLKGQPLALMALAFHNFFTKIQRSDAQALVLWADSIPEGHVCLPLARELAVAGKLYLSAHPQGVGADGTCLLRDAALLAPLWQHYQKVITNRTLNPMMRITLGCHLSDTYLWSLPSGFLLPLAHLVSEEMQKLTSLPSSQVYPVLNCFCRLPITQEWETIAHALWKGIEVRHQFRNSPEQRIYGYSVSNEARLIQIRLAAKLKQAAWIDKALQGDSYLIHNGSAVSALVESGYPEKAAILLRDHYTTIIHPCSEPWNPEMRKHLPALVAACKDPGLAFIAKLLILRNPDPAPQVLRAFKEMSVQERVGALAPGFGENTPFANEADRFMAASIIAGYAPVAAYAHLADLCAKAVKNKLFEDSAENHKSAMAALYAVHAVHLISEGKPEAWDPITSQFRSYQSNFSEQRFARHACQILRGLWERGEVRESKFWLPLIERKFAVKQDGENYGYGDMIPFAYAFATQLPGGLVSWKNKWTPDILATLRNNIRYTQDSFETLAAFLGSPGAKGSLPDEKRTQFVFDILSDAELARHYQMPQILFEKHPMLTLKELLANAEKFSKTGTVYWGKVYYLGEYAIGAGLMDEAGRVFDILLNDSRILANNRNFVLTRKAALLIRTGKNDEAKKILSQLEASGPAASLLVEIKSLNDIISRSR